MSLPRIFRPGGTVLLRAGFFEQSHVGYRWVTSVYFVKVVIVENRNETPGSLILCQRFVFNYTLIKGTDLVKESTRSRTTRLPWCGT